MHEDFLLKKLDERVREHSLRTLQSPAPDMIDFCSNDYLGIVKNQLIGQRRNYTMPSSSGATGSRLLSGNSQNVEELEDLIATFHQSPAGLIFNSGYAANTGLLSCVPQRGDTILYDYLCHASIRDGMRLSFAQSFSFLHNDLEDLERKLQKANGTVFVVTESVFSMDGDYCPLYEIVLLCEKYGAKLVLDEAHATGVVGEHGEGLAQMLGLQQRIFARVHTFGKACGTHGAIVLGTELLRSYLINFARPFVYSTALPEHTLEDIRISYGLFPAMTKERDHLRQLSRLFQPSELVVSEPASHPIKAVVIPGNEQVRHVAATIQQHKFDARPILYPTVPKGGERLRIVLHAFNSEREVTLLLNCLKNSL